MSFSTNPDFVAYCYHQHDIECNQKYGSLPYSYHLKSVINQYYKFRHLLPHEDREVAKQGCAGHDLIEDARVTFNNVKEKAGQRVADVVFLCTEMRGRDRAERKNDAFYNDLKTDKIAVFVKLCDIIANMLHGATEGGKMFKTSCDEYPKIKAHLYCDEYNEMFEYIEKIIKLKIEK